MPVGLRVIFTELQIRRRVLELAAKINRAYRARTLHIVGLSEDCFLFMADLVRALTMPVAVHFVTARVRQATVEGVPVQEILYSPQLDLAEKDVLLLSGIVYSGVTLDFMCRQIQSQGPHSLRTATLIEKPEDRKVNVSTDYLAFKSEATAGQFLVGYGLGYQGLYRNLPCIAAFRPAP
jgi:hypoxanthine phosphoribosyltransferase